MSLKPLDESAELDYLAMKERTVELVKRFNVLTGIKVSIVNPSARPKFNFSEMKATLSLPKSE